MATTRGNYPSDNQRLILTRWTADGAHSLEPPRTDPEYATVRHQSVDRLRELGRRLDLSGEFRSAVADLHRLPLAQVLTEEMRVHLHTRMRLAGLVMRDGARLTPWTPMQARVVLLIGQGLTVQQASDAMGLGYSTVTTMLTSTKIRYAVRTSSEMVGRAYRRGWLPLDAEAQALLDADTMGKRR